jgi:hypothetical protein
MSQEPNPAPTFSALSRWGIGLNVACGLAAALALVLMVNYLSARHHWRFPLGGQRQRPLSPQTLRVLASLTNHVKITLFFDTRGEEQLYNLLASLTRDYAQANPHLSVRTIDPARQPADAELLLATYQLHALKDRNFVVLDCEGRPRVLYANELAESRKELLSEGPPREFLKHLVSFRGEAALTTALFNIVNARRFKIAFTQGHGEHDPDRPGQPHGYAKFAQAIREKVNADIEKLLLLGTNEIPADCQLLIIAGPREPFAEPELARIDNFLHQGGRLLALVSNPARNGRAGLESLLARWNVAVGQKILVDPQNAPTDNALLAGLDLDHPHAITKALAADAEEPRILLVLPRAVGPLRPGPAAPDAPSVQVLAHTGEAAIEVSDVRDGVPYRNPLTDLRGSFPVLVAVEQGSIKGVTADRGSTRIVAAGDSLFLDNEMIETPPANRYFGTLAVDWLLDRPQVLLEGLVPQLVTSYRVVLTDEQLRAARWLLLAALPAAPLLLGALVWWRRRR